MIRFIKKFAVFFIAALVLTFIWFKTAGAAETLDAARLEALAKRLNDFTSLEADFTQKRTLGAAGRTLTSTGTLSLTGDGAFSWVQKTPFVQTVSLKDGVFTIRYEDEAPEVMKAETHPAVLSAARLLTSVMRLDAAALRDAFAASNVYTRPDCADCWAKLYCAGGCAANAYHATGSVNGVYKYGCELFRKRMECAIMLEAARALDEE